MTKELATNAAELKVPTLIITGCDDSI